VTEYEHYMTSEPPKEHDLSNKLSLWCK